jgi:uncharacterized membrane protein
MEIVGSGILTTALNFVIVLIMLSIPILIIALGVSLGARLARGQRHAADTPLDVLKLRHARGEITREQFEQMKRALKG